MSAILKQNAVDIANAFEKYGLWKGGGSGGSVSAEIKELWSGQQSESGTLTLIDDYSKYDIIISQIEPLENYPTQQSYAFMVKGGTSLTGGMCENTTYITQYRLREWNGTSVYFSRDTNPSGWNVTLKKIYGIKFNNEINEYSTEEKVIGKWIDGRNIYRKVIVYTVTLPYNTWVEIPEEIGNKQTIFYACGLGISNNGFYVPLISNIDRNATTKVRLNNFRNNPILIDYCIIEYIKNE